MKRRTDFVSNSSSTSFAILDNTKDIFTLMRSGLIKYPEFESFLNFYCYMVVKNNLVTEKLNTFISGDKNCGIVKKDSFNDYALRKIIEHNINLFGYHWRKIGEHENPTFSFLKDINALFNPNGKQVEYEEAIKTIRESNEYSIYYINNTTEGCSCRLNQFLSILSNEEFDTFIDSIIALFDYIETDDYCYPLPSELDVFLKYNKTDKQSHGDQ